MSAMPTFHRSTNHNPPSKSTDFKNTSVWFKKGDDPVDLGLAQCVKMGNGEHQLSLVQR
jgi:hypothetical protein